MCNIFFRALFYFFTIEEVSLSLTDPGYVSVLTYVVHICMPFRITLQK